MLLHKELNDKGCKLILASQSPRRRELMSNCGFIFRTVKYDVEEIYPEDLSAGEVSEYLSKLKSEAYPEPLSDSDILITADTTVVLNDQILGKPKDAAHARKMLAQLSGATHEVVTGVTLRSSQKSRSFSSRTKVSFTTLTSEQIDYYVDYYSPMDKAGSYGIQEWIGYIGVEGIEGSFYNVMGLPIQHLCCELQRFIAE